MKKNLLPFLFMLSLISAIPFIVYAEDDVGYNFAKRMGGTGVDVGSALATDFAGNIYILPDPFKIPWTLIQVLER